MFEKHNKQNNNREPRLKEINNNAQIHVQSLEDTPMNSTLYKVETKAVNDSKSFLKERGKIQQNPFFKCTE